MNGDDVNEKYYHSWIVFHFKDELFVFDPCLQYICPQKLYYQVFAISKHDILGTVTSKSVQEYLIYKIKHPKKKNNDYSLSKFFEQFISERQKKETYIMGDNNINSPAYRNSTGYTAKFDATGKIESLLAHYYYIEG